MVNRKKSEAWWEGRRPQCNGTTWKGTRCANQVKTDESHYCGWHLKHHDPSTVVERQFYSDDLRDKPFTVREGEDPDHWKLQCDYVRNYAPYGTHHPSHGTQCNNWALRGLAKCKDHVGDVVGARELGERIMAERALKHRLDELAEKWGAEGPIDNPLLALQMLSTEVVGFKDWMLEQVKSLDSMDYTDSKGVEGVRAVVELYERAIDRTIRLMSDMSRLKIEERLAAISERQGELVAMAIERTLEQMDLESRKDEARNILTAELQRISAA